MVGCDKRAIKDMRLIVMDHGWIWYFAYMLAIYDLQKSVARKMGTPNLEVVVWDLK